MEESSFKNKFLASINKNYNESKMGIIQAVMEDQLTLLDDNSRIDKNH